MAERINIIHYASSIFQAVVKRKRGVIAASEQCETLYQSLKERLEGDQLLLNRFDAAKNNETAIAMESIYQQGFQDCVYLLRWIGAL